MKKLMVVLLFLVACLLPACCVFQSAKHARSDLPVQLESKTVAMVHWMGVVGKDEDGDPIVAEVDPDKDSKAVLSTYCAGVWVSNDTFLTANHCVEHLGMPPMLRLLKTLGASDLPAWDATGQTLTYSNFGDIADTKDGRHIRSTHQATVLATDTDHDLALVKATPGVMDRIPSHDVATVATDAKVGEDVHIVGHTVGLPWTYCRGWVAQVRPQMLNADEKPVNVLQISAPVWFGNSGGGAFNAEGELVGISSWIRKAPNVSFFVDYNTVSRFLRSNGLVRR